MDHKVKDDLKNRIVKMFVKDVNRAYDVVLNILGSLYEKNCVQINHSKKPKTKDVFLCKTNKEEILNIVKKPADKRSKDWVDMDIFVKDIIGCVTELVTCICNLFFQQEYFHTI